MAENKTILLAVRNEPNGNPPAGYVYVWADSGVVYTKDDAGVVRSAVTPDFGKNFSLSVFEDYTMTTSGTSWDTYAGLQCPSDKAGEYIVFAHASVRANNVSNNIKMRIAKGSSTIGEELSMEMKDSSSNNRNAITLIRKVTLLSGDYLDLDFATENSNVTLTVHSGDLILWRV